MQTSNKHIFIVTYDYPPSNGGIARLCFELKKYLEKKGLNVTVICPQSTSTDAEEDNNVVRLHGRRGILELRTLKYLRKKTVPGDIVITGNYHPEGMLSLLSNRETYILAHGAEYLAGKSFFRRCIWPTYRRFILRNASCVIANSHYTETLVKHCSPNAKTIAIPLAVDAIHFRPTCEKYKDGLLHLCSISRLEKFKGHDFIIRTIASLPAKYKQQVRLHLGGKGKYKSALERMVTDLGLSDIVSFEGFIDDNKLCDFYSASHIFILCTREEADNRNVEVYGLVFAEAQACGTAVIGTRTGGIPDAVEENNGGWLIHQDAHEELENLLIKLIDDKSLAINEGRNARRRIEAKITWEHYVDQICDVIL